MCVMLGQCSTATTCPSLRAASAGSSGTILSGALDLCATEGVAGGTPTPLPSTTAAAGSCRTASDCDFASGQLCQFAPSPPQRCTCSSGRDVCVNLGTCVSYCSLPSVTQQVLALNAGARACDTSAGGAASQCGAGETCTATSGCQRWACDGSTQRLVQVGCSGLCVPQALRLTSARLSDDGRSVTVALSAAAALLLRVPCGAVFDAATAAALGGGAVCSTGGDGPSLLVEMQATATVKVWTGAGHVRMWVWADSGGDPVAGRATLLLPVHRRTYKSIKTAVCVMLDCLPLPAGRGLPCAACRRWCAGGRAGPHTTFHGSSAGGAQVAVLGAFSFLLLASPRAMLHRPANAAKCGAPWQLTLRRGNLPAFQVLALPIFLDPTNPSPQLSPCTACREPRVSLAGPSLVTQPCSSGASLLLAAASLPPAFDAALSADPSGRPLADVRWAVAPGGGAGAASRAVLQGAVDRSNTQQSTARWVSLGRGCGLPCCSHVLHTRDWVERTRGLRDGTP